MTTPASPAKVAPIKHPPVQAHAHRRTCDELGVCNCATPACGSRPPESYRLSAADHAAHILVVVITILMAALFFGLWYAHGLSMSEMLTLMSL